MKNKNKSFRADAIGSYFRLEWLPLLFVTLSGLVYNVGLLAGPWYEGRLAQCPPISSAGMRVPRT